MNSSDPSSPQPVVVPSLQRFQSLRHGFSTRIGGASLCYRPNGDLNLGFTKHDDPEHVRENRRRFLRSIHADNFARFGLLRQIHSPTVHPVRTAADATGDFLQPAVLEGDGLLTDVPGVLLTVQVADCIPVLVFHPQRRVVAAFHAGWRGTAARIVEHGIALMRELYGCNPADAIAAIGPGIGPASYTVGEEVRQRFAAEFPYADTLFQEAGPQLYLNLWEANRQQLLDAGLNPANITVTGEDTAANTARFFSHRAENGFTGRMMAAIGMTVSELN